VTGPLVGPSAADAWDAYETTTRHGRTHRPQPRPLSYPQVLARRGAHEAFVARVLSWHRLREHAVGTATMCFCGEVAVLCPYLRAAHEILGHPVPWEQPDPPAPQVFA
jgi:hypothetical protein